MAIKKVTTKAEMEAIPEPKRVVMYNNEYVVYTEEDLEVPPKNPAEGE